MRRLIVSVGFSLWAAVAFAQPAPPSNAPSPPPGAAPGPAPTPAPAPGAAAGGKPADGPSLPKDARGPGTKTSEADQTCRAMLPQLMAEAEKGNPLSAFRVGIIYDNGCGVRGNQQVAAAYYEIAAKGGHADGAVHLAMIYIDGEALKQDYDKARSLLDKPSKAGHPVANYLLGVIAYRGDEMKPPKPDVATAMKYFRAAADGGFAQAQFIIGQAAAEGVELPKDGKLAKVMLLRAAAQGHGWAQAILGRMLADKELPDADPVEAMTWLSLAKRDYGSDALLLSVCEANLKKVQPRLSAEQLKQAQDRIAAYQPRPEWEEKI